MTRKQRPRGSITREAVVSAALAVVDRDGVDKLTIRSIAKLVGAPPMSLYTHFANKNELLDLMFAGVASRLYEDQGHATWQKELEVLCHRLRKILRDHPNWTPLLARHAPPLAIKLRERVLQMMIADGIPDAEAFRGFSGVALLATGLTMVELTFISADGRSTLQHRFDRLKEWTATASADEHPVTRATIAKVKDVFDESFVFTVQSVISGLELRRTAR
jgi:AcrR family transcriptional regulator